MKKILLVLVALLCVATVSAKKSFAEVMKSQEWTVGLRVGSGLQADASWVYSDNAYVEARFGMSWLGTSKLRSGDYKYDALGSDKKAVAAHFEVLHNWNIRNWDWTPSVGKWFLDVGCGLALGGYTIGGGTSGGGYGGGYGGGIPDYDSPDAGRAAGLTRAGGASSEKGNYLYVGAVAHAKFGIKFNKVPIRLAVDWTPVVLGTEYIKYKKQSASGHYYANGWANFAVSAVWCF